MSHVLYAYIAKPTTAQMDGFFRALLERGFSLSHLGKSDPPRKFCGSIEDALSLVFFGTDVTDYTFARDAARKLDFDIQINHDPRWTHSTVSASCSDSITLAIVAEIAVGAFDSFITVQGVLGLGKDQVWNVVHVTEECPEDLRSRFAAT